MVSVMKTEISRLTLLSPIFFVRENEPAPFNYREGDGEKLFCFELDETQAMEVEPDKATLLGNSVFGGKASDAPGEELSSGHYLFAQKREILSRDAIVDMAVEIQKEGLWQRLVPGKKLYLRYLFEDGRSVTQLFRPYTGFPGGP